MTTEPFEESLKLCSLGDVVKVHDYKSTVRDILSFPLEQTDQSDQHTTVGKENRDPFWSTVQTLKTLVKKPGPDSAPKGLIAPLEINLKNRVIPPVLTGLGLNSMFSKIPMLRSWILWSIVNLMPLRFFFIGEGCSRGWRIFSIALTRVLSSRFLV